MLFGWCKERYNKNGIVDEIKIITNNFSIPKGLRKEVMHWSHNQAIPWNRCSDLHNLLFWTWSKKRWRLVFCLWLVFNLQWSRTFMAWIYTTIYRVWPFYKEISSYYGFMFFQILDWMKVPIFYLFAFLHLTWQR